MKITKIEPKSGPYNGGSSVTIYGSGFQSEGAIGVRVYFGDRRARVLSIDGDNKLVVEPPGGEMGSTTDIKLVFDDAREFTYPNAYTYVDLGGGLSVDQLVEDQDDK